MKKISKFIKSNYKFLIGLIIGGILSGTSVYAANTIYSKNVTYDNSNSGLSATNVQDALDETYSKCIPPTAADSIINLYNDGSSINTVNIGGDTANPQVKLNATQGIMLDNNGDYRYYGANPNNYVTFNGETWRIIGAFNNVDNGTGNKETRLKIIRDDSIGRYSWDSSASTINYGSGVNDWSKADLMTELNTLYYNSQSGTCYNGMNNASTTCNFTNTGLGSAARGMVDNAVYYLGGVDYGYYANEVYDIERSTAVYNCSTNDGACPRATTWTGKIGMIYFSDALYATDLSLCKKKSDEYVGGIVDIGEEADTTCIDNNWLATNQKSTKYWSIISTTLYGCYSIYIEGEAPHFGSIDALFTSANIADVYPTVYIKSDITIT